MGTTTTVLSSLRCTYHGHCLQYIRTGVNPVPTSGKTGKREMHPLLAIVGVETTIGHVVGLKVGVAGAAATTKEPNNRVNDAWLRRARNARKTLELFGNTDSWISTTSLLVQTK